MTRDKGLLHKPASQEEINHYKRGILMGVMQSATPNVVASLIVALEAAWAERETREATLASFVDCLNTRLREAGLDTHQNSSIDEDMRPAVDALATALVMMRQRRDAVAHERDQLTQRIRELERGEYICRRCGLRKDGESEAVEF